MKKTFLTSVVLSAFTLFPLFAQQNDNTDEIKKQINKIKKNNQYIYAESTAPTETDARNYAEEKLYEEVNAWVETQRKLKKSSNLVVNNKKELWTILEMPRGSNMFRSFIYVKKNDILPVENSTVITNTNIPVVEEKIKEELPVVINKLASYTKYADIVEEIKKMKENGQIKEYARYASLNNPDVCYLIIYNRDAKIEAILTPGKERRNIKTNKPDGVKNYSGCGAIGIEL
ncbi:hypothetical protein O6P32_06770 [Phocaeicola sp. KGMB11183]|uniref:Uncharacterized protein n=1 Tax=Phocaeicola acetigenes TaxID=3016083 RepID=A0ABT4PH75_9BACT|nr:hypothetical protein [Phocaeicola sp. KGMB11183]MCZ8372412.1 hypothetical protein [Phocaeicola sp. KGMB11183]